MCVWTFLSNNCGVRERTSISVLLTFNKNENYIEFITLSDYFLNCLSHKNLYVIINTHLLFSPIDHLFSSQYTLSQEFYTPFFKMHIYITTYDEAVKEYIYICTLQGNQ